MTDSLLKHLLSTFEVSGADFEIHRCYYNNHFDEYDNDIYQDIKTRLVHLCNFFEENWFNKRYDLLFEKYRSFDTIVEVGFGLPYIPLTITKNTSENIPSLIYVDRYPSAIEVSKEILKYLKRKAYFIEGDIENEKTWALIEEKARGETLLVAIEALEHLGDADNFWKLAKKLNPSKVIVSIPIGPKIPSHRLSFLTENEARDYLKKFITIEEEKVIGSTDKSSGGIDDYKDIIVFGSVI